MKALTDYNNKLYDYYDKKNWYKVDRMCKKLGDMLDSVDNGEVKLQLTEEQIKIYEKIYLGFVDVKIRRSIAEIESQGK
jgi:ABC-type uncharacterized transport system YnjBCD substrate-binding protein